MSPFRRRILDLVQICAQKKIDEVVISPGSRSAPLTIGFVRHSQIRCRAIVDERSAAFVALGMAQQLRRPVALVCTSGTAALNYAPAVAEAFYQQIPLLIFTADRPVEWLEQNDGQTIIQRNLYQPHCNASFEFPVDDSHPDSAWHAERVVSEAINATLWPTPGPVHVNVPLREPLYPDKDLVYPERKNAIDLIHPELDLNADDWTDLIKAWQGAERRMIVAGLHPPDPALTQALIRLQKRTDVIVLADVVSNCAAASSSVLFDMILGTASEAVKRKLQPDLLISFGGPIVSKNLKLFLRKYQAKAHWHIQPGTRWPDPFQSLQKILPLQPRKFLVKLTAALADTGHVSNYLSAWHEAHDVAAKMSSSFFEKTPFCELSAMREVLKGLPESSDVQLGNSSIVRLASLVFKGENGKQNLFSNRGTCGIDGTVSTAVGAAIASEKLTTLLTGDLAFFYDRNGLWHSHVPSNLRIIVFNNQGGGIFRILDGSRQQPELDDFFEVEQTVTAENVARDHGLDYSSCDSLTALSSRLTSFFERQQRAAILEIHFDKKVNSAAFLHFKSMLKEIQ